MSGSARHKPNPAQKILRIEAKKCFIIYLSKALENSQMSRKELAEKLGVCTGRISQLFIENDESIPLPLWLEVSEITKEPFVLIKKPTRTCEIF